MSKQPAIPVLDIKAIVGLGNPGPRYYRTRHSIGFQIVDALADRHFGNWQTKPTMDCTTIRIGEQPYLLIKPMTYMNDSGKIMSALQKQGIKSENILVVHDELEKPFNSLTWKFDGSARGHNGLRSIIAHSGADFLRLRVGINRPAEKSMVADYVLQPFDESTTDVDIMIQHAVDMIEAFLLKSLSS